MAADLNDGHLGVVLGISCFLIADPFQDKMESQQPHPVEKQHKPLKGLLTSSRRKHAKHACFQYDNVEQKFVNFSPTS